MEGYVIISNSESRRLPEGSLLCMIDDKSGEKITE